MLRLIDIDICTLTYFPFASVTQKKSFVKLTIGRISYYTIAKLKCKSSKTFFGVIESKKVKRRKIVLYDKPQVIQELNAHESYNPLKSKYT